MTKATGKGRGGERIPGPGKKLGRPPSTQRKQPFLVKLPPEVIAWLRARKEVDPAFSMGGWIGHTLRDAIRKQRQVAGEDGDTVNPQFNQRPRGREGE